MREIIAVQLLRCERPTGGPAGAHETDERDVDDVAVVLHVID